MKLLLLCLTALLSACVVSAARADDAISNLGYSAAPPGFDVAQDQRNRQAEAAREQIRTQHFQNHARNKKRAHR